MLQQSWVRSQWNLRGGWWSSVEKRTWKENSKRILPLKTELGKSKVGAEKQREKGMGKEWGWGRGGQNIERGIWRYIEQERERRKDNKGKDRVREEGIWRDRKKGMRKFKVWNNGGRAR
jgi:hypothetical protein